MTEVTPIGVKRWNKADSVNPADFSMRDMLETALHRLDSGDYDATHMILVIGVVNEDRSVESHFMQAGKLDSYGQLGLMTDASRIFLRQEV